MSYQHKLAVILIGLSSLGLSSLVQAEPSNLTPNEQLVMTFYQQLFGDKDLSAIDKYIAEDYIQHNPNVADGKSALKQVASQWLSGTPKEKIDLQRIASKDDIVFLHIRSKQPNGDFNAVVDIFRVEGDKIVEHWDVIQTVPKESANPHPMF